MIILNFSHPLTDEQIKQIESLTGRKVQTIHQIPTNFDNRFPFATQVMNLINSCNLTPKEWQTLPILIVPPSYNFIAVTLIAALQGIMGYFPPIIRLRQKENTIPPRFEVAEIINLQELREKMRKFR